MAVMRIHYLRLNSTISGLCCVAVYAIAVLLLSAQAVFAALHDPFPIGYSMENFGTILWENSISGRQPWFAAAFLRDTAHFGISAAGVYYYDPMDNMTDNSIRQAAIGAWFVYKKIGIKAAYQHFSALDIYREQKGFLSVGTSAIPYVSISAELEGFRAGLANDNDERENIACGGITLWAPWSFASASLSCSHILLKDAHRPGFAPPLAIVAGIHTAPHRFGAQGVKVEIEPGKHTRIRFYAGEEYWLYDMLGLSLALSTNPLMVSFGVTLDIKSYAAFASFVHHPVLGWSKGAGMEYVHK
jgi:hypothetical protein